MKMLGKVFAVLVAAAFVLGGTPYANAADTPITPALSIVVNPVNIWGYAEFSFEWRDISDNSLDATPTSGTAELTFADEAPAVGQPWPRWVHADQYAVILARSNYLTWGVLISTDNLNASSGFSNVFPNPTAIGLDGAWGAGVTDPAWYDNAVSYGGLLNPTTCDADPNDRATLAWCVYSTTHAPASLPTLTDSSLLGRVASGSTMVYSSTAIPWNSDWAAVVDQSNRLAGTITGVTGISVDLVVDPDNDYNTVSYYTIMQGGTSAAGLNYVPAFYSGTTLQSKLPAMGGAGNAFYTGAVYFGAKLGVVSPGDYSCYGLTIQMYRE